MTDVEEAYNGSCASFCEGMEVMAVYCYGCCFAPDCIAFLLDSLPVSRAKWFLFWTPIGLTVLYSVLLAILKYRATSQRKLYRTVCTDNNDGENKDRLVVCLKRLFYSEAKMAPCSHPALAGLWIFVGCLIVLQLFPLTIFCVFVVVAWLFHIVQISMSGLLLDNFKWTDDLVYNGQHFKAVWLGVCNSVIQDEKQNTLYYPTIDLYGLVAPGNL